MTARLFTYTIPIDDGAAPNPFRGICTLAICKPRIRRVAQKGDWIAGFGSVDAPSGDLSKRLVYAMCVDETITLKEYDERAAVEWPHRIPNINSLDMSERLGDCIYDYSVGDTPTQRPGVHGPGNIETDLGGEKVLISKEFYYFGSNAISIPEHLWEICHQTQGHRSDSNAPYFDAFVRWLNSLELTSGQLYGWPDYIVKWDKQGGCGGCVERMNDELNPDNC